jgi:hypothetical protein
MTPKQVASRTVASNFMSRVKQVRRRTPIAKAGRTSTSRSAPTKQPSLRAGPVATGTRRGYFPTTVTWKHIMLVLIAVVSVATYYALRA